MHPAGVGGPSGFPRDAACPPRELRSLGRDLRTFLSGDPNSSHNQWTQRRCGHVGGKALERKPQAVQSSYFKPDRCGPRWGSRRGGLRGPVRWGEGMCERPAGTQPPGRAYPFCLLEIGEARAEGPRAHGSARGNPAGMWQPEHPQVKTRAGKASAQLGRPGVTNGEPAGQFGPLACLWGPRRAGEVEPEVR